MASFGADRESGCSRVIRRSMVDVFNVGEFELDKRIGVASLQRSRTLERIAIWPKSLSLGGVASQRSAAYAARVAETTTTEFLIESGRMR